MNTLSGQLNEMKFLLKLLHWITHYVFVFISPIYICVMRLYIILCYYVLMYLYQVFFVFQFGANNVLDRLCY
jgi:hypothetical protein